VFNWLWSFLFAVVTSFQCLRSFVHPTSAHTPVHSLLSLFLSFFRRQAGCRERNKVEDKRQTSTNLWLGAREAGRNVESKTRRWESTLLILSASHNIQQRTDGRTSDRKPVRSLTTWPWLRLSTEPPLSQFGLLPPPPASRAPLDSNSANSEFPTCKHCVGFEVLTPLVMMSSGM
jgi:hypothetical protein